MVQISLILIQKMLTTYYSQIKLQIVIIYIYIMVNCFQDTLMNQLLMLITLRLSKIIKDMLNFTKLKKKIQKIYVM